jgi:hypothetical protein
MPLTITKPSRQKRRANFVSSTGATPTGRLATLDAMPLFTLE